MKDAAMLDLMSVVPDRIMTQLNQNSMP